jgi:hypothetical protein
MLAKLPGFAAIVILRLALGIGANTALCSIVNGVLLNPLPYPHSARLVALYGHSPQYDRAPISYPNFLDWQHDNHVFSSMAMYGNEDDNFTGRGEGEHLTGTWSQPISCRRSTSRRCSAARSDATMTCRAPRPS